MTTKRTAAIFGAIVAVGAAVRVFAFFYLPNMLSMEVESYSKLHLFLQWIESPLPYPDTNFGPLHMLLLWLPFKLTGSLVWSNRVVSLLFSIGVFFPLYDLVRRTAGERAALVSCALLSAAALPVSVGVVTLSEGPYIFFFIAALAAFARLADPTEKPGPRTLFVFAALMSAALALRFESWMFLPVWPIVLWRKRGIRTALACTGLLSVFPLVHMYVCWSTVGHPLMFIIQSQHVTAINSAAEPVAQRALSWMRTFLDVDGAPMLIAGLAGVGYVLMKGPGRLTAFLFVLHFAVVEAQALRAAMAPELHRYAALMVLLLIPPAGQLIAHLSERLPARKEMGFAASLAAAFLLSASTLPYLPDIKRDTDIARVSFLVARQLRKILNPADRVFMGNESHPLIVVESGGRWSGFTLPFYPDGVRADPESCRGIFKDWRPTKILAYRHDPSFKEILGIESCRESVVFGAKFKPVFEHDPWCILSRESP